MKNVLNNDSSNNNVGILPSLSEWYTEFMSSQKSALITTTQALRDLRESLESAWTGDTAHPSVSENWKSLPQSTGQCFVTAVVVSSFLNIPDTAHCISRGSVITLSGISVIEDHCWIEHEGQIIDLTLDQTPGYPAVVHGTRESILHDHGVLYEPTPRTFSRRDALNGKAKERCLLLLARIEKQWTINIVVRRHGDVG